MSRVHITLIGEDEVKYLKIKNKASCLFEVGPQNTAGGDTAGLDLIFRPAVGFPQLLKSICLTLTSTHSPAQSGQSQKF